jgi:predicted RNA-binding protein
VVTIRPDNWEFVVTRQLFAFRREANTRKVVQGDRLVAYVPGTFSFKGVFEIVSGWSQSKIPRYRDEVQGSKVIYPYEASVRVLAAGTADLRKIKDRLSFIKDKNNFGLYFQRNPGNFEQPISTKDYELIMDELHHTQEAPGPIEVPKKVKPLSIVKEDIESTGHFQTRDLLVDLGKLKGMEESIAEFPFDHFKLDVIWKRSKVRAYPDYAFEVHKGGDIWKDLVSLKHAFDRFGCQVVLVGQPEDRSRVEQQLPGAFHEMSRNFRFIETKDITKLHTLVKQSKELERMLGL